MTVKKTLFNAAKRLISTAHIADYVEQHPIAWTKTRDPLHPYETSITIAKTPIDLKLRINDFPEEPLYTVVFEKPDKTIEDIVDVNDFKDNWSGKNGSYTP